MWMKLATLCVVSILAMANLAEAQICTGAPTFRDGPFQVGLIAAFTEGAQGVGGTFAAGGESLFAGAGVSVTGFDDLGSNATAVDAFAGAEFVADSQNRVFLCPVVQVGFHSGPDVGDIDVSGFDLRGGGSVGVIAAESNDIDLQVVPFFGLAAAYQRVTVDFGDDEITTSDSGGIATLGLGLIFNRNVGITPQVSIPFAVGDSDVVFAIRLTFNFGR
jgi:hypothetical protein